MISRRGLLTGFAGVLVAPAIVRASSLMPVVSIRAKPLAFVPCDGRKLSKLDYPELYRAIGQTYGGDGPLLFQVPDFRGRYLRDASSPMNGGHTHWLDLDYHIRATHGEQFPVPPGTIMPLPTAGKP